jgi:hypothetical protein
MKRRKSAKNLYSTRGQWDNSNLEFKDSRSVFEKQGERVIKFRKIAQKRGMKNPEAAGERMYHKWRKKHGIKHDEGGFKSILGNVK